jgi:hypothetical protein
MSLELAITCASGQCSGVRSMALPVQGGLKWLDVKFAATITTSPSR